MHHRCLQGVLPPCLPLVAVTTISWWKSGTLEPEENEGRERRGADVAIHLNDFLRLQSHHHVGSSCVSICKCLSPIKELPSPMPTPLMSPLPHRPITPKPPEENISLCSSWGEGGVSSQREPSPTSTASTFPASSDTSFRRIELLTKVFVLQECHQDHWWQRGSGKHWNGRI